MIENHAHLNSDEDGLISKNKNEVSQNLIENYLTNFSLPEGIAVNFLINGKDYLVPMVTEEPSVVAAASNGAKMLSQNNGISAEVINKLVDGEMIFKVSDKLGFENFIKDHKSEIIKIANQSHPSALKHGDGAQKICTRSISSNYLAVDMSLDAGESMGANTLNTMLEACSKFIAKKTDSQLLMAILTNYSAHALVKVVGKVSFDHLAKSKKAGKMVAQRIAEASEIAQLDIKRATTHNKGIMNGIDAVAMAFGNDFRALEAAVHSFAANSEKYHGISTWEVQREFLVGKMTIPIPVGFVGGATSVLPLVEVNKKIAEIKNVKEEMKVIASVGLAQNLAALKALVSEGIQKGHMNLQLKSMALANGAKPKEVDQVVAELRKQSSVDARSAKKIIRMIRSGKRE